MHLRPKRVQHLSILLFLVGLAVCGQAATTATFNARIGYDSNLYLQDPSPSLTAGSVSAKARAEAVTSSAALSLGWAKTARPDLSWEANYTPEIVRYKGYRSENHDDHRFTAALRGRQNKWSYEAKGSALFIHGSKDSPIFNRQGGGPAIAGEPVRSRRTQDSFKFDARFERALPTGFIRTLGAWSALDFHTRESAFPTGYANYVDRSEWSTGTDLGWTTRPGFSLVAGARVGEQHQADLLGISCNTSNRFLRTLVGAEARFGSVLNLTVAAGPDFRRFDPAVPVGFDRDRTAPYIDAIATWTPNAANSVTASVKSLLWPSSSGRGVYQDTLYDLQWKYRLGVWTFTPAARLRECDSRPYNPTKPRHEWIYISSFNLARPLTEKIKFELIVAREWSESLIANTPGREYTRWTTSAGWRYAF